MRTPVEHDEWVQLTPLGLIRGCNNCGREVLGYTPLLLPCPAAVADVVVPQQGRRRHD